MLLQPSIRRSPLAHEIAHEAEVSIPQTDAEPADQHPGWQSAAANEPCAKMTDHDWRWHTEPTAGAGSRVRYVFRCHRCQLVGAHVDGA